MPEDELLADLSDEELEAIASGEDVDLSSYSDEELEAIAAGESGGEGSGGPLSGEDAPSGGMRHRVAESGPLAQAVFAAADNMIGGESIMKSFLERRAGLQPGEASRMYDEAIQATEESPAGMVGGGLSALGQVGASAVLAPTLGIGGVVGLGAAEGGLASLDESASEDLSEFGGVNALDAGLDTVTGAAVGGLTAGALHGAARAIRPSAAAREMKQLALLPDHVKKPNLLKQLMDPKKRHGVMAGVQAVKGNPVGAAYHLLGSSVDAMQRGGRHAVAGALDLTGSATSQRLSPMASEAEAQGGYVNHPQAGPPPLPAGMSVPQEGPDPDRAMSMEDDAWVIPNVLTNYAHEIDPSVANSLRKAYQSGDGREVSAAIFSAVQKDPGFARIREALLEGNE